MTNTLKFFLPMVASVVLPLVFLSQSPFITTCNTELPGTSAMNQMRIPAFGDYTIDWQEVANPSNNGTEGLVSDLYTVTFPSAGIYSISITPSANPNDAIQYIAFSNTGDKEKILNIEQWGDIKWQSMSNAFSGCANLTSSATDTPDLSASTDFSFAFSQCYLFNGDLSGWDVSQATNFGGMFFNCHAFNSNISSWNTALGVNFSSMFLGTESFNQPIGSWNTSSAQYFHSMFNNATAFNQPLNSWNTANVVDMHQMFKGASVFNGDVSAWNTQNVQDFREMFQEASMFDKPLTNWNTSSANSMKGMFDMALSFNQSVTHFNVSNISDFSYVFHRAESFNQPLSAWDISEANNLTKMLSFSGLNQQNYDQTLIGWSVQNVQNGLFLGADSLYYFTADSARNELMSIYNWIIINDDLNFTSSCLNNTLIVNAWLFDTLCLSGDFRIGGNPSVTGGLEPYAIEWITDYTVEDPNALNPLITPNSSINFGYNNCVLKVTDAQGCVKLDTVVILTQGSPSPVQAFNHLHTQTYGDTVCTSKPALEMGGIEPFGSSAPPYTYQWIGQELSSNSILHPTLNVSNLSDGYHNYELILYDATNCYGYDKITVFKNSSFIAEAHVLDSVCTTDSLYLGASPTAVGGTGDYSYQWSEVPEIQNLDYLTNYTSENTTVIPMVFPLGFQLEVIDNQTGCSASDYVYVNTQNCNACSNFQASVSTTNETASNASDGTANVTALGGNGNFNYIWSNGANGNSISGLSTGWYSVTVTDSLLCSIVDSGFVDVNLSIGPCDSLNPLLVNSNLIASESVSGANDGEAEVMVSGGTSPYNVTWSNGFTGFVISGVASNTYTATVEDSLGCIKVASIFIPLDSSSGGNPTGPCDSLNPLLVSSNLIASESVSGANDGVAEVMVSGGTSPYNVTWSNGFTGFVISGVASNTYTATVEDSLGCIKVASIFIPLDSSSGGNPTGPCDSLNPVVINVNSIMNETSTGANDGFAQLSISGGTTPYGITWSNGSIGVSLDSVASGTYAVTVTDDSGCVATLSVFIPVDSTMTDPCSTFLVDVTTQNTSAIGANDGSASAFVVGGTPPYAYTWQTGDTTSSISNLSTGTYTLNVLDANSCVFSGLVSIGVDSSGTNPCDLIVSLSTTDVSAVGAMDGSASAFASGANQPYGYSWSNGSNTPLISGLSIGVYYITVQDAIGCSVEDSVQIYDPQTNPCPGFSVGISTTNASVLGSSDGSVELTPNGGVFPYSYFWNTTDTTATLANISSGTYFVTITDNQQCEETAIITIGVEDSTAVGIDIGAHQAPAIYLRSNPIVDQRLILSGVNYKTPGRLKIRIYDAFGKALYSEDFYAHASEFEHTILVHTISSGMYWLYIEELKSLHYKTIPFVID